LTNISASPVATSTRISFEERRDLAADVLEGEVFGAFILAVDARKRELGMTQAALAERLGKEKTGTSKLLSRPGNWQLSTIAGLGTALDVIVEINLVDRLDPSRKFTPTGVEYTNVNAGRISVIQQQSSNSQLTNTRKSYACLFDTPEFNAPIASRNIEVTQKKLAGVA